MTTKFGTEARLGLVIFTAFIIFIWGTMQITNLGEDHGYEITAVFDNASGLDVNAPVRMVGVNIGRVKSIDVAQRKALVTMQIADAYRIDRDAAFAIRSQGILGDKYVEIIPGQAGEYLEGGDRAGNTRPSVDLDSLMESLQGAGEDLSGILASLRKVVATEEGENNLKDILQNTRDLSDNLNRMVSDNRDKVDSILANLDTLTAKLDGIAGDNRADIRQVIANIREVSENLKDTIPNLTERLAGAADQVEGVISENREGVKETVEQIHRDAQLLEETLDSLRTVAKRIEDGEGTVGKLINEDETYTSLNETLGSLNKAMKRAERLKINLDIHGHYLSELEATKGYLTMDIHPNPEKFYRLQIVDDPEGLRQFKTTTTSTSVNGGPVTVTQTQEESFEDKLKFSVELGRRYHDTTFRLGYIESAFGFGIDHYNLDDNMRWTLDAWELDRDDNPRVRLALSYRFLDYFHIDVGGEDLINKNQDPSFLLGFGIRFVDDDLKYILANSPIP